MARAGALPPVAGQHFFTRSNLRGVGAVLGLIGPQSRRIDLVGESADSRVNSPGGDNSVIAFRRLSSCEIGCVAETH
jgi:hypothetical protein